MASTMKIATVVEGVETQQQLVEVREWGCTEMQGHLFSRPKPVKEILPMLARHAEQPFVAVSAA